MEGLNFKLIGDDMQAVVCMLQAGQKIRAEAGAMMYMTSGIAMDANLEGGLLGGLKRKLTGESFMIPTFSCNQASGEIAFASPYPGKILNLNLNGETILCQKDAYLCSFGEVDISIAFTRKLGAGFFGGEGFILEKLSGTGQVFLHAGGTILDKNLVAGEILKVDTGCLVGFDETVDYDIEMVKGIKTMFFGGEGLFLAVLKGPGRVWLQTLPFARLADRIISGRGVSKDESRRGGSLGGVIGDLISGK
jgi:uncharacterized protein (TIGR00266 family)